MAPAPLVPAWRRLGLKLTNEEGKKQEVVSESGKHVNEHARKRAREGNSSQNGQLNLASDAGSTASKRRRLDGHVQGTASKHAAAFETHPTPVHKTKSIRDPSQSKRKSVSFSAETKQEDGQSNGELLNTWQAENDAEQEVLKSQATSGNSPDRFNGVETNKRPKRPKKKARFEGQTVNSNTSTLSNAETTDTPPSFLVYLSEFQHSRSSWKFNKSKQTHLLRHILNLKHVPQSYNSALREYLLGLKGESIKAKVREQALKARDEDESDLAQEPMERHTDSNGIVRIDLEAEQARAYASAPNPPSKTTAQRKAEYKQAIERWKAEVKEGILKQEERDLLDDPKWEARLKRRRRSELVIWSVGESNDTAAQDDKMWVKNGNGKVKVKPGIVEREQPTDGLKKRKRKRKRRTGVPDDETSSDSTDSSGNLGERALKKKLGIAQGPQRVKFVHNAGPPAGEESESSTVTSSLESDSEESVSGTGSDTDAGSEDESGSEASQSGSGSESESESS